MIYDEIKNFYHSYKGRKCVFGYSCQGRELYAFHVGEDDCRQFIAVYAVHAREYITARLALRHISEGVKGGGGWVIPLLNPDGVRIAETSFPLWKANGRGVDLNCNFDADWGSGRLNTTMRGGANCIGDFPFSENETAALRDFTLKIRPFTTLSFHTKGEVIYWEFNGKGDERGAALLREICGYEPTRIYGSAGGYKDWCIQKLNIPAYTIECGSDELSHPIKSLAKLKKCYKLLKKFIKNYGN